MQVIIDEMTHHGVLTNLIVRTSSHKKISSYTLTKMRSHALAQARFDGERDVNNYSQLHFYFSF